MKIGSLFSGYSGLDMAVERFFDAETAWVSDIDKGACKILAHHWPDRPNLSDITKIDWSDVEPVDILTGGFPCQDLSHAGKRAGLRPGTRSGLWTHMAYAISQLRPRYVIAENVRGLLSASADSSVEQCAWCVGGAGDGEPHLRALGAVLGDLAELGYDAQWVGLRAADVGAPHGRFRVFIVATTAYDAAGDGRDEDAAADSRSERYGRGEDRRTLGRVDSGAEDEARQRQRARAESGDRGAAAAEFGDPGDLRDASSGIAVAVPAAEDNGQVAWGAYEPAIRRWEAVSGRVAPAPTETSAKGSQRLSPAFVEWMMGLPAGHVTAVPGLTRNEQLKALGNGVVPQQAFAALGMMINASKAAA